jgi:hypothetical protein
MATGDDDNDVNGDGATGDDDDDDGDGAMGDDNDDDNDGDGDGAMGSGATGYDHDDDNDDDDEGDGDGAMGSGVTGYDDDDDDERDGRRRQQRRWRRRDGQGNEVATARRLTRWSAVVDGGRGGSVMVVGKSGRLKRWLQRLDASVTTDGASIKVFLWRY